MVPGRSSRGSSEESKSVVRNRREVSVAARVESIIGCKWSLTILERLGEGCRRPSEMLRACPGLSAKVMNERWRKFMRFGLVRRIVFGEKPPVEVEYHLTPFGERFMAIIEEVRRLQDDVDQQGIGGLVSLGRVPSKTVPLD